MAPFGLLEVANLDFIAGSRKSLTENITVDSSWVAWSRSRCGGWKEADDFHELGSVFESAIGLY